MFQRGVIKTWNDEKGFGFIAPEDGSSDAFVHITAFVSTHVGRPAVGAPVGYTPGTDAQGRPRAAKAWLEFGKVKHRSTRTWGQWISAFLAVDFLSALGVAAWYGVLPSAVPVAYLAMSLATFSTYMWDKWRARSNGDRVAEATLHLLEMLGGWPGALVAQHWLRHKVAKRSYQIRFWVIAACHAGIWVWLGWRLASRS